MIVIAGASGAGKSAALPALTELLPSVSWHEFDSVGVPADADTSWRQRTLEAWVRRALELETQGTTFGLCGQVAYGELLACPSAPRLRGLSFCLLDCDDVVRIKRLRAAGRAVDQDTLNWAAWLRVHAVDPQWRPDVITGSGARDFAWERWANWTEGDPRWQVQRIDTSDLSITAAAKRIAEWAGRAEQDHTNPLAVGTLDR